MSKKTRTDGRANETEHAMLVIWGQYAHCLGIPQGFSQVAMKQKTVTHTPQSKVLEFFVAHLAGLEHMKDISRSAHPLDQDQAVAQAWGEEAWADYSGMSRTLSGLTEGEVAAYIGVLEASMQALIDGEVQEASGSGGVILDGDLTPRPVSEDSRTYPGVSYGHMNDRVQLGYQAGVVTMSSKRYGRLGLSACRYTGKTTSVTQAESLVREAERRIGRRPERRTDLLAERVARRYVEQQKLQQRVVEAEKRLARLENEEERLKAELKRSQERFAEVEANYQSHQLAERPNSKLARVRKQMRQCEERREQFQVNFRQVRRWFKQKEEGLMAWKKESAVLTKRLDAFLADNAANANPLKAILRLDAGFGDHRNLALLIEMGYEIYTKPFGNWLSGQLAQASTDLSLTWRKVSWSAEMVAYSAVRLDDFPYPLDIAFERFWHTQTNGQPFWAYGILLHFGLQEVCADMPGWFRMYNSRQTIEAANKEVRQVFAVQHIKVRTLPAMQLQESFALLAANFVRFAAHWMALQCPQVPDGWQVSHAPRIKEQVKVGAHLPARIEWFGKGCVLRFPDRCIFAGRSLRLHQEVAIQLSLHI